MVRLTLDEKESVLIHLLFKKRRLSIKLGSLTIIQKIKTFSNLNRLFSARYLTEDKNDKSKSI